jgi:hypothetical protein
MPSSTFTPPHMMDDLKKTPPYDGHSSESESRKQMPGSKKRPSRAGTRSVTTLTAAQLERKRANDREAQRAIRQRTKDHIDTLERQVRDLTAQLEAGSSSKMMDLMRRNEDLEQENAVLRARLSHAVSTLGVPEQTAGMSMTLSLSLAKCASLTTPQALLLPVIASRCSASHGDRRQEHPEACLRLLPPRASRHTGNNSMPTTTTSLRRTSKPRRPWVTSPHLTTSRFGGALTHHLTSSTMQSPCPSTQQSMPASRPACHTLVRMDWRATPEPCHTLSRTRLW